MTNDEIADVLKQYVQLYELHDGNPFKIKSYNSAVFRIDKYPVHLAGKSLQELEQLEGIGKSVAGKIVEIVQHGSFTELDQLLDATPEGVLQMLRIKGLGPKKVQVIWKQLGVESVGELLYACYENRLAQAKGFGQKTQDSVVKSIEFMAASAGKFHYAAIESSAMHLVNYLKAFPSVLQVSLTGDLRRKAEVVRSIEIIVSSNEPDTFIKEILSAEAWRNVSANQRSVKAEYESLPVDLWITSPDKFVYELWRTTGNEKHVSVVNVLSGRYEDERELYASVHMQEVPPELREGTREAELAIQSKLPQLIDVSDLRGTLHNHSTYSDGADTLEAMAQECISRGYEYLGICDHSKSAQYAGGLKEGEIIQQHLEIDALNRKLSPFRIFKGIESDILNDGSLDYSEEVLRTFDFVVASVHSNLKMNEEKAMTRLIKAIENPFTTILGHPTGRLLLIREGYPVNHQKMIDACAANGVIIELNAHPYRLDMDWRWIDYAIGKGVKISINPDAHNISGFSDMYYGTCVARKGFLTAEMCFNALSRDEISAYFEHRKASW